MQLDNNDEILAKLMQPSMIDSKIMDIKKHLQDVLDGKAPIVLTTDDELVLSTTCKSQHEKKTMRQAMEKTRRYYLAEELLGQLMQSFIQSQKQIAVDFATFLQGNEQFRSKTVTQKIHVVDSYLAEIGAPDALRDPSSAFFIELRKHF
ncbi:hypothetical protein O0I10_004117 [Lichtheimia ornata]|uniref:Uncharacterized protein n=1 Tax=Lichtheimia ornata TaxID=688661 RepID=A0AAD7V8I9_9FUNG|nr:uncharacterized protein O0I10_004117 [Lichtheimia ornata]KAJ8660255.1 hypothetical protein O0I10_004117 [Lichtheimia ornata]